MPGTYDTATNSFRRPKPLPLPRKSNRKPFPNFAGPLQAARPFVRDPKGSEGTTADDVKYPKGVGNGKY